MKRDKIYNKLVNEAKEVCRILDGIAIEVEIADYLSGVYAYVRC